MPRQRPKLNEICAETYDLLIIGGGVNGCGIAREAAMRGLKVLLVEKADFASGTSSRSTKLAHGGLRYLERFEFSLVRESLRERSALTNVMAPHLCVPQHFMIPFYAGDARRPVYVRAGLWLYDFLAIGSSLGRHRDLNRADTMALEPALNPEGLRGSSLYWDCRVHDARLTLENAFDAERWGARCLNYVSVRSAHRLSKGDVRVRLRDELAETEVEARASLLINASGPWVDEVLGQLGQAPLRPLVKPTKGIHLITKPLTQEHALLLPSQKDGRIFFVIPWSHEGRPASLVGTTDTDYHGDLNHLRAEDDDIRYLTQELKRSLPGAKLDHGSILGTYAGLRPLTAPAAGAASNSTISREWNLVKQPGLWSLTGGKLTTYRAMAEKIIDQALQVLAKPWQPSLSAIRPLLYAPKTKEEWDWWQGSAAQDLAAEYKVSSEVCSHLLAHYGLAARAVLQLGIENSDWFKPVVKGSPAILAQAVFAARHEKAEHLTDFYLRRTFLGLEFSPEHSGADRVAAAMGGELAWSRDDLSDELADLQRVIYGEYRL